MVVVIVVGAVGYKQGWFDKSSSSSSAPKCTCGEAGCQCAYCVPTSSIMVDPLISKNPQVRQTYNQVFITPYPTYNESHWDSTFGKFDKCGENQVMSRFKPGHCIDCVTQDSLIDNASCSNSKSLEELIADCKQKGGTTMGKSLFVPPSP